MSVASPPRPCPVGPSADHVHRSRVTRLAAVALALTAATWSRQAHAIAASSPADPSEAPSTSPPARHEAPPSDTPDDHGRFRLGALAGVGFPRPLSFEVFARFGGYVGLGAEYGLLPTVSFDGVSTSTWAASADLRIFPFEGAFFLGLRGGYQHLDANASVTASGVSASASADLDTWFLNPRLGFLWTMKYGFTVAIEAGVQIPLTSSFDTTLPAAVALQVRSSSPVQTLSGVLPTVDLLRVGLLF